MDKMTIKVSYQNKRCNNNMRVLIYKNIIGQIEINTAYTVSLGFLIYTDILLWSIIIKGQRAYQVSSIESGHKTTIHRFIYVFIMKINKLCASVKVH